MVTGAPSVLYDAVVLAVAPEAAARLSTSPVARDFVTDAFAHCKFIGYTEGAGALFDATGIAGQLDNGVIELRAESDIEQFLTTCTALRYWPRHSALG
jgi:catalase